MRARAARRAVSWVGIDQAVGLAADGEARGIVGALQLGRAVRAQVNTAVGDVEAGGGSDGDGQVVTVDEGHIVVVESVRRREGEPIIEHFNQLEVKKKEKK